MFNRALLLIGLCVTDDYESYREATHDLHLDGGVDASALRHLPLRVHLGNAPAIQMPIAPRENGVIMLLCDGLLLTINVLLTSCLLSECHFQVVRNCCWKCSTIYYPICFQTLVPNHSHESFSSLYMASLFHRKYQSSSFTRTFPTPTDFSTLPCSPIPNAVHFYYVSGKRIIT